MTLGAIIQKKRNECGMSQEQLAELIGVSRQAVSKWEVGDAIPDTDKLVPLARALNISVDELLGNVQDAQSDAVAPQSTAQSRKPGWFATQWYWLGLIPVAWGVWQLLWLLIIVLSLNGQIMEPAFGGMEIITSGNAFLIN